jgi:hypothetical protein
MTIPFEDFKAQLLADPKVKAEYDKLADEFEEVARMLKEQNSKRAEDDLQESKK